MLSLIILTGEILRVVLQVGERIDAGVPGIDLLPDIVGEGVIIVLAVRSVSETGTVGIESASYCSASQASSWRWYSARILSIPAPYSSLTNFSHVASVLLP